MNYLDFIEENHQFRTLLKEYLDVTSDMILKQEDLTEVVIQTLAVAFHDIQDNGKIDIQRLNRWLTEHIQEAKFHRAKKIG